MADKRLDQTTNASAVAAADNIPFVTAAGVTSYVTGDELAASGPFSSRYQPVANDRISVGAAALGIADGTPTNSGFGGSNYNAWYLDQTAIEILAGMVDIPSWWNTYHVDLVWSQNTNGVGDVRWTYQRCSAADGATSATTGSVSVTAAAPAQTVFEHTRLETSATIGIGEPLLVSIVRRGDLAADTLPNDCALLGLIFTRAS